MPCLLSYTVSRKEASGEGETSASPVPQGGDAAAAPAGDEQPQVDVKLTEQAAEGAEETAPADEVIYSTALYQQSSSIHTPVCTM